MGFGIAGHDITCLLDLYTPVHISVTVAFVGPKRSLAGTWWEDRRETQANSSTTTACCSAPTCSLALLGILCVSGRVTTINHESWKLAIASWSFFFFCIGRNRTGLKGRFVWSFTANPSGISCSIMSWPLLVFCLVFTLLVEFSRPIAACNGNAFALIIFYASLLLNHSSDN